MMQSLVILIPLLPLAAAIVVGCIGWLLKGRSHLPVVAALAVSFVLSLLLLKDVSSEANSRAKDTGSKSVGYEQTFTLWQWANIADAYPAHPSHPVGLAPGVATKPGIALGNSPSKSRDFKIDVTLRADP